MIFAFPAFEVSSSTKLYGSLGVVIFLATFGFSGLVIAFTCILCFIFGFLYVLYINGKKRSESLYEDFASLLEHHKGSRGLPKFLNNVDRFNDTSQYEQIHSMTNSPNMDAVLEQLLTYIMRDYVDSWYKNLSSDECFRESLKRTSRRSIGSLSQCMRQVDWVKFFTRDAVDDFASHLRLFRVANEKAQFACKSDGKTENTPTDEEVLGHFFDIEYEMEKTICRDLLSTTPHYENAYLHDLVDIILYLVMPPEDFRCRPLRFLLREVLVRRVIVPLLDNLSDPNEMNQLLVWLLSEVSPRPEDFVTCLENSRSVDELDAFFKSVVEEKTVLRGKDSGGDQGVFVKQQLGSLDFVEGIINRKMALLTCRDDPIDALRACGNGTENEEGLVQLPIHVVLTNSIAVSYLIDYLQTVGGQNFIDCYLAIEGFKVSVEHQLRSLANGESHDTEVYETIREAAQFMYQQYLSQEAITRVPLEDSVVKMFRTKIADPNEPSDYWFEHIQDKIVEVLRRDDHFYPSFKRSPVYVRMLHELGIMGSVRCSLIFLLSLKHEGCVKVVMKLQNAVVNLGNPTEKLISSSKCVMKDEDGANETKYFGGDERSETPASQMSDTASVAASETDAEARIEKVLSELPEVVINDGEPVTSAVVETLGIGQQGNQSFALYNLRVSRAVNGKKISGWNVLRRYSDFHTLHSQVIGKYPKLATLAFPGKKTFNNLDAHFLEKRTKALNQFVECLLQPALLKSYPELDKIVFEFLSQKEYTGNKEPLTKKMMSAMFDPIRLGVKAVGNTVMAVPDQVFDGVTKVGAGINTAAKIITQPLNGNNGVARAPIIETDRVAAAITDEDIPPENIPLRVLVLFVDEVFGVRARNVWFRRQMMLMLRQFVTPFGTSINKRIIDLVSWLTGEQQVVAYLAAFRDLWWPDGQMAGPVEERSEDFHHRSRLLAKSLMLSVLPDELRLILGAETTYQGINTISNALQNRQLNRRLLYVLLERLLVTVFPKNRFDRIFTQLHSKSPRVKRP